MAKRSVNNQMIEIINDADKKISHTSGVNGILARLWRIMLRNENVTGPKWLQNLADFMSDSRSGQGTTTPHSHGNYTKQFSKPEMTFKSLIRGLRIMKVRRVTFYMECEHDDGHVSYHDTGKIDLGKRRYIPALIEATEETHESDDDKAHADEE